jgi:hypothetical protein
MSLFTNKMYEKKEGAEKFPPLVRRETTSPHSAQRRVRERRGEDDYHHLNKHRFCEI